MQFVYTIKRLTVLQKTIPAVVDFVKQSWKKRTSEILFIY